MKGLLQRVSQARVEVEGEIVGSKKEKKGGKRKKKEKE